MIDVFDDERRHTTQIWEGGGVVKTTEGFSIAQAHEAA